MTDRYLALRAPNDDMAPRVDANEVVIFDTQKHPDAGDDVLIELPNGTYAVRILVEITRDAYRVERFRPSVVTTVPKANVAAVYPIIARADASFWQEIEDAHRT